MNKEENKKMIKHLEIASEYINFCIGGLIITPNKPIYRNSEEFGEYAVTMDKNTIAEVIDMYANKAVEELNTFCAKMKDKLKEDEND
jgi:hypothetical protein